jgi:hypothetical protein
LEAAIEKLLEAHVQHELSRFQRKKLQGSIREEVAAAFQWAKTIKLGEVVSADQITDLIHRNVVARPLPPAVKEQAIAMAQRVLAAPVNEHTTLKDICPRPSYDAALAKIGQMEGVRRDLIHRMVSSSVYTEQISNALYAGIKEYLLTENVLAQKVPGLASLIKLGKFAVDKTMKPLEAVVEKTVKAYIEANLGNTIRRSETSINAHFAPDRIVELGDQLWDGIAPYPLLAFTLLVDGKDMDDFVSIGNDFWRHFRETPYFKAIYTDLVRAFFEKYGDAPLSLVASDFGVNQKVVTRELSQLLAKGLEAAAASGFLEQRIRARLEDFYRSPQAMALLTAASSANDSELNRAAQKRAATQASASKRPAKPGTSAAKRSAGKPSGTK